MKKIGDENLRKICVQMRRKIQRMMRREYWQYINNSLASEGNENRPSLKRFWTYIKSQRSDKTGISQLKVNGRLITDPEALAETLNNHFQSVFSDGTDYNQEEFEEKCGMSAQNRSFREMEEIVISEDGIRKQLQELDPHKAPGPDGISPRVLRELAPEIAPILRVIFESSLTTGEVPQDWKDANVTPIFKKGEHYEPANYRPVSLTSIPCKILEHIIVSSMMNHFDTNSILCSEQHGFRKGKSCETQLIEFVEDLNLQMAQGEESEILIMDFAKAFDKVNHSLLMHKLHCYGIKGSTHRWIQSFLQNRRQAVVVSGARSELVSVRSGVPQGSVLGPSLFLAYINDLPQGLNSQARLFADDTAVHRAIQSVDDQHKLQVDLDALALWEMRWDMQFHPGKCTVLPITRKQNRIKRFEYKLHGQPLQTVQQAKYLGVTIREDLKWDTHVDEVCNKANKTLGFLRRNLKISSSKLKDSAYKTLVRPILEYAAVVWDPHTETNCSKLEAVQRRAARFVCNDYRRTSSVTAMLERLSWKTLQQRRKEARLIMFYKIRHSIVQLDKDLIETRMIDKPVRPRRGESRQHDQQYVEDNSNLQDYRLGSFFPRTVGDWNKLRQKDVEADTLGAFTSRVRSLA
jgi:hypothetical protein